MKFYADKDIPFCFCDDIETIQINLLKGTKIIVVIYKLSKP